MRMTIGSVMDDINEWQGPNGTVYYVTAFFTNSEMLSCGKKDMDAALEVRGLLQEIIEVPQEFILEPKGQTKKGAAKWNLKAFGPPEGVWTYSTIKDGSPNVGAGASQGTQVPPATAEASRVGKPAPEPSKPAPTNNVDASIRASVALKAAASFLGGVKSSPAEVCLVADKFDEWLAKKSGGTAGNTPPDRGVADEGEASAAPTKSTWQERVKDWPDPSENPL